MSSALRDRARSGVERWRQTGAARVYGRARNYNLVAHVLALGAQQVLCTAPLVVAVSALVQRLTGRGMGRFLAALFGLDDEASRDVDRLFSGSQPVSLMELVIGVVVALAFATGVAATQQRGIELLWGLPRADGIRIWVRQAVWGVALAVYVTLMALAGRLGHAIGHVVALDSWVAALLQGIVTALFYWWGQRLLLDGRVSYRSLLPGAAAIGVGMIALVKISPLIVSQQIDEEVADYGLIGAVFVLSVWLMVLSAILLGGVFVGVVVVRRSAAMKPVAITAPDATPGPHVPLTEPSASPTAAPAEPA